MKIPGNVDNRPRRGWLCFGDVVVFAGVGRTTGGSHNMWGRELLGGVSSFFLLSVKPASRRSSP